MTSKQYLQLAAQQAGIARRVREAYPWHRPYTPMQTAPDLLDEYIRLGEGTYRRRNHNGEEA